MPERCVVAECSNVKNVVEGISLHRLPYFGDVRPVAKQRRRQWVNFVQRKRASWEASKSSVICSSHSKADDFERRFVQLPGLEQPLKARLREDEFGIVAIPSVYPVDSSREENAPSASKRERRMVSYNHKFMKLKS